MERKTQYEEIKTHPVSMSVTEFNNVQSVLSGPELFPNNAIYEVSANRSIDVLAWIKSKGLVDPNFNMT